MGRNLTSRAVVLRNRRVGEFHKGIDLFTEQYGIVHAIAYGAYKGTGKLTGVTDPFSSIFAYIYVNPVKQQYKISDVECYDQFVAIRTTLDKYYHASLWAEVLLKSFGGGEHSSRLFTLLLEALTLLEREGQERISYLTIQFLWHYIITLGFKPTLSHCDSCGKALASEQPAYYYRGDGVMVCEACSTESMQRLSAGGRAYLAYTAQVDFDKAVRVKVNSPVLVELKTFITEMIEEIVENPLNTIQSGAEFF
jgi:DNA repair protein RecO (recombination protein O)